MKQKNGMGVYLDDSGDDKKNKYVVCGGILGDEFGLTFTDAYWSGLTGHLKNPFRSTECECQQGQFKDWKKVDCDKLMQDLVGVLNCDGMFAGLIGTAVPVQIFRKIFPNAHPDDPFRLAVRHVMVGVVRMAIRNDTCAKLCFEKGPNDADVRRAYDDACQFVFPSAGINRLAGLSFSDKSAPLLQAADLAARECFKAAVNRGVRPTRKPLKRLWGQSGMLEFDESCLLRLKNAGGPTDIRAIVEMGSKCHMNMVSSTPYSQTIEPV
ncbi:MAG TPA: hypothetical protein VNU94_03510 [Acidobacteriaceae bacterium]|jgi:hypothetical protein|nr:hypothetical protein [Acidobacteriaceae bacterium]